MPYSATGFLKTGPRVAKIIELLGTGMSLHLVAEAVHTSKSTVWKVAKANGITTYRGYGKRLRKKRKAVVKVVKVATPEALEWRGRVANARWFGGYAR
ncbi:MAG: hypothetical protein QM813_17160 [Verrucomicrobiota bacterium]